jgi:hypothetical protein
MVKNTWRMRLLCSYINNRPTTFLLKSRNIERNVSSGEHKITEPSKSSEILFKCRPNNGLAKFQASATKEMKYALFWNITQRIVVIPYLHFFLFLFFFLLPGFFDAWRWDQEVIPKRQQGIITTCCVISHKSADFNNAFIAPT